jgi:SAM-dependent methyltransferase
MRPRAAIRGAVDRLPIGRDRVLRVARSIDRRRATSGAGGVETTGTTWPRRFQVEPEPRPVGADWPEPPDIDEPGRTVRSVLAETAPLPGMDVALFEALNTEYASKPIHTTAPGFDTDARSDRARARLERVHRSIDLADQRILEFGCGAGFEVWYLSHHLGADATGVDVAERAAWSALSDARTRFVCADLAADRPFEAASFDRVISFSVFEHVQEPAASLAELFRVTRPGGLAWISANLHRGPLASHLYRDVHFPWPHLLFEDDVFEAFYERQGKPPKGASWVNHLTWAEYEDLFRTTGWELLSLQFSESPFDEAFYERFKGILGRYPREDLTRDFFTVVARRPA